MLSSRLISSCPLASPVALAGLSQNTSETTSRRHVTSVARHQASPVTVSDTTMSVSPRKCGPPESPQQVPPLPVDGFISDDSCIETEDGEVRIVCEFDGLPERIVIDVDHQ